jgi:hypothetical protein
MGKNKKQWIFFGGTVALMLFIGISYELGWRLQNNFLPGKVGKLSMTLPLQNTSVFVDNNQKVTSSKDNETIDIVLSPKKHTIIVSKENYFPWTKVVIMTSNGKMNLNPVLVSQNATGQVITNNDPEYWKIKNQITKDKLPSKDSPLVSLDKSAIIWIENNAIVAKINNSLRTIIQPNTPIKNISFYKDRSDALIFSTAENVYMIETDTANVQNFMPIYRGQDPRFIGISSDYIYVEDSNVLMQVII